MQKIINANRQLVAPKYFSLYFIEVNKDEIAESDTGDRLIVSNSFGKFESATDACQALEFFGTFTSEITGYRNSGRVGLQTDKGNYLAFWVVDEHEKAEFRIEDFEFLLALILTDYERTLITAYNEATGQCLPFCKESHSTAVDSWIDECDAENICTQVLGYSETNRIPSCVYDHINWDGVLEELLDDGEVYHARVDCEDFYFSI